MDDSAGTQWPRRAGASLGRRAFARTAATVGLLLTGACDGRRGGLLSSSATVVPSSPSPMPTQAAIASPVPGYADPSRWLGRAVTVASQGGTYQAAQTEAIFAAFAAATGAAVRVNAFDLNQLRRQVDEESVTWDVADVPTEEVLPLARGKYLLPIDYRVVDRTRLFDDLVMQHGVGSAYFSTVIIFAAGAPKAPSGWPDVWDVEGFPGKRALRRGPVGTLEFALLAAGVAIDRLYPLDVDLAFASLDRIRPAVAQWYDNALQPVELVLGGDVAIASSYSVRAQGPEARSGVAIQWSGGMLSADSWVVPRGAPNADVAMDLINFATRAIPAANLARLLPFGPVNRDAFGLLRPDRLTMLPNTPQRRAAQFVQNWNWWADNREALTERFDRWLLEEPTPAATAP